jgi:hypothetical protein
MEIQLALFAQEFRCRLSPSLALFGRGRQAEAGSGRGREVRPHGLTVVCSSRILSNHSSLEFKLRLVGCRRANEMLSRAACQFGPRPSLARIPLFAPPWAYLAAPQRVKKLNSLTGHQLKGGLRFGLVYGCDLYLQLGML